eukprot:3032419-Pyramimonas_sp.AAC.1
MESPHRALGPPQLPPDECEVVMMVGLPVTLGCQLRTLGVPAPSARPAAAGRVRGGHDGRPAGRQLRTLGAGRGGHDGRPAGRQLRALGVPVPSARPAAAGRVRGGHDGRPAGHLIPVPSRISPAHNPTESLGASEPLGAAKAAESTGLSAKLQRTA